VVGNWRIQVHYKHSKVKQYFKEGRALRTETTVNDTYDFGIGRLVTQDNWDALVAVGHDTNERLLGAQLEACPCAPDAQTLERVVLPEGRIPGLNAVGALAARLTVALAASTPRAQRSRVARHGKSSLVPLAGTPTRGG
jgi:hypothetical protein